jgi:hypothetical protein
MNSIDIPDIQDLPGSQRNPSSRYSVIEKLGPYEIRNRFPEYDGHSRTSGDQNMQIDL